MDALINIETESTPNFNNETKTQQILSLKKFILLFILTQGFYGIWWMYKEWRFFERHEKIDINPVARSFFFSFFYYYFLLEKIRLYASEKGYKRNYYSWVLH